MSRSLTLLLALSLSGASLHAQQVDPEFAVNNFFRVRSTAQHVTTLNYYPYSPTCPAGYVATTGPGVVAGTRLWTYTPKLRSQMGAYGANFMTVTGVTQSIYVGPAVTVFPAPNHYQFRCGIAQAQTFTGAGPYQMQHTTSGADIVSVADANFTIPNGPIWEISTTLATPIPLSPIELCFFLQYRGGEYQDDPNGGQTAGCDYQGGRGPGGLSYCGFAVPAGSGWTVSLNSGGYYYRPKCGFLIQEPVLTITGHHANGYYQPLLVGEYYRSIGACLAPWSNNALSDFWFDVRAGSNYGSSGLCVAFLNVSPVWFPAAFTLPWGQFFLNPTDPLLDALTGAPMILTQNGTYLGEQSAIKLNPFGPSAIGLFVKTQGIVFNAGFNQPAMTNSTSILIE